jgi:GxxExxY protein
MTNRYLDQLTHQIIGAAIEVHKSLGPGLLERVYHRCMEHELKLRGIQFESERYISIEYKGVELGADLRCDLDVEESIIVELKAVKEIEPIHHAVLLSYMKLLERPKGILLNFYSTNIWQYGQKTFVNEFFTDLPYE